jgi:hypothetical protein
MLNIIINFTLLELTNLLPNLMVNIQHENKNLNNLKQ